MCCALDLKLQQAPPVHIKLVLQAGLRRISREKEKELVEIYHRILLNKASVISLVTKPLFIGCTREQNVLLAIQLALSEGTKCSILLISPKGCVSPEYKTVLKVLRLQYSLLQFAAPYIELALSQKPGYPGPPIQS